MKRIEFTVDFRTKFGFATDKRKCHVVEGDAEGTFKNALKALPKWILKTWDVITFEMNDKEIAVMKHHLEETNFDFWNSVDVNELA